MIARDVGGRGTVTLSDKCRLGEVEECIGDCTVWEGGDELNEIYTGVVDA